MDGQSRERISTQQGNGDEASLEYRPHGDVSVHQADVDESACRLVAAIRNEEADALANGNFENFDVGLRMDVIRSDFRGDLLPEALELGMAAERDAQEAKVPTRKVSLLVDSVFQFHPTVGRPVVASQPSYVSMVIFRPVTAGSP